MRLTLVGIDPGIVDTGLVQITLDSATKKYGVNHIVWSDVVVQSGRRAVVSQRFLEQLAGAIDAITDAEPNVSIFVEGYRNRGKNINQDQQMTLLVEAISEAISFAPNNKVVDNTGVKNVVKPAFMAAFKFRFPSTNHRDLESAARIALKGGLMDTETNVILSSLLRDYIDDKPWQSEW